MGMTSKPGKREICSRLGFYVKIVKNYAKNTKVARFLLYLSAYFWYNYLSFVGMSLFAGYVHDILFVMTQGTQ
jgi:hypothetical protein